MARRHGLVGLAGVARAVRLAVGMRLVAALLVGLGLAMVHSPGAGALGAAALVQSAPPCPNDITLDDDGDGIVDADDPDPCDPAIPGDAQPTQSTDSETVDTDGDGLDNASDPDDDNDGVTDADNPAPFDSTIPGAVTPTQATDSEGPDNDGDGLDNASDPDDDNDGTPDADDPFPFGDPPSAEPGKSQPEPPVDAVNQEPGSGAISGNALATGGSAPLVTALPSTGEGQLPHEALTAPLALILLGLTLGGAAGRLRRGLRTED